MAAALLIDDVLARRGNFPAFKIEAERIPTTYRQALGMSAAESAQWDCIRAVGNESDLVDISLDVFRPEVVERNQNIIVSYELVRYLLQALYDTDVADSEIVAMVLKDRNGLVLARTL
ncbi:hypothetical protein ONZ51_g8372 [Trametes cubensis]|uniref:Uncharacterized protein n=1 Tax=Trametes cubensis TaxID=1111947 RepID=A0AAD7TNE3_9APHY|nr:hypothetical protein ONZ51_g8372 [Trametes cubensis]